MNVCVVEYGYFADQRSKSTIKTSTCCEPWLSWKDWRVLDIAGHCENGGNYTQLQTSLIFNAKSTLTMKCPDCHCWTDHKSVQLCQAIIFDLLILMGSQFGTRFSMRNQNPPATQCFKTLVMEGIPETFWCQSNVATLHLESFSAKKQQLYLFKLLAQALIQVLIQVINWDTFVAFCNSLL